MLPSYSPLGNNLSGTIVRSFRFFYFGTLDSSIEGLVRINPLPWVGLGTQLIRTWEGDLWWSSTRLPLSRLI